MGTERIRARYLTSWGDMALRGRSCENVHMPLSEDEQRILRQLEQQLETDKEFAQNVSQSGLYRHAVRTVRWAALGMVASLGFTIATLQVHFALAFLGFLGMLACAVVIEGKLRAMSKAGYKDVVQVLRTASLNSKAKMRSKFDRNI
ncbi:MAG: DUF3040 domain-containing protein [Actinobacteria bacterium]|nr:DUF3040 domain-containing protein [Actinomycetota bacterium]NCZ89383.1 DUF3040 domain-containing protein [Actinomycetota bacterium]NCZ91451.1 DUF3040 domain-containing protein [Actinomycetota bacterium]NCZ92454.1 DUF3040 domain-containing protein [Actinomycetota bacterium]NDF40715.1 DUF3040 domain-containing protein [Actinomycetota bacterium]